MNILRQLMEKPWERPQGPDLALAAGRSGTLPAQTVGLWMFLCVVTVLFSLLVAAYAERMGYVDWRPTPRQWLLWFNTALLIESSLALQWAFFSIRRGRLEDTRVCLIAAGILAVAFLLGQLWAWRQLSETIAFGPGNPAVDFFYLITALHGLHLLGGLVAWGRTTLALKGEPDLPRAVLRVRLCATYWHFLLGLWLVLFILLFSGNDNLTALLAFCGLK